MNREENQITAFILKNVEKHPTDIVQLTAEKFGFSRQRAHQYISREVKKGTLIKTGRTRWTKYFLTEGKYIEFSLELKPNLDEYEVWTKYVKPMISKQTDNIKRICAYGFTEMFNNAIDHSEGKTIFTEIEIKDRTLIMTIMDNGIGIFRKIQEALGLSSIRESLLHLSKGKFTTDPTKHSGEGIFFTSRIFNSFSIFSSDMFYTFKDEDWFLSKEKSESFGEGTLIKLELSLDTQTTPKDVFDQYSDQEIGFGKTTVAVALSSDPNDPHVSRSQAKRLLMGLEKFRSIILDFKGVESVGQAFVDEIFRVFKNEYPEISIFYVNTTQEVEDMIKRGIARANE